MLFDVEMTRRAEIQRKGLRGRVLTTYTNWLERLRHEGCRALDYRMTGETVERLCVRHLSDNWRVIVAFPEPRRAVIVLIGQHLATPRQLDVYRQLYQLAGVTAPSSEHRRKPPCCEVDGTPPEWADLDVLARRTRQLVSS